MTTLALSAPATSIAGLSGLAIAASGTSLATFAGFSVPNNGQVLVFVWVGASGAGNLQFLTQRGASQPAAIAVSASTNYIFGPFDPSVYSDGGGLLQATISVVTGNSVSAYTLPGNVGFRATHNPFENVLTMADA